MHSEVENLIQAARSVCGEFDLGQKDFSAGSVAAAIRSSSGTIYTGICFDLACGIGFCAEHSAVAEMLKSRETRIEMVVAVGKSGVLAPCGRCRELMIQINAENAKTKVVLDNDRLVRLEELLPEHWLA